jgi:CBS domain-containing protein
VTHDFRTIEMLNPISEILDNKSGELFTVLPATSVADAVHKMNEHGVGALLVMDNGELVGILTERDILVRVLGEKRDASESAVSEVMTPSPYCVSPYITIESAMHVVNERRVRHLPVVEDDRLVGMVSIGDLTRHLVGTQQAKIEDLARAVKNVTLGIAG